MFESLDFLYVPAPDFEDSLRYYTEVLGGELLWKIHEFGTWVGAVKVAEGGPVFLLAGHKDKGGPQLIYRVKNLKAAVKELKARGWKPAAGPFGIPSGDCYSFEDPAGNALAIYENQRPGVMEHFAGRTS